jgi:hypothetical protein
MVYERWEHLLPRDKGCGEAQGIRPESEVATEHDPGCKSARVERNGEEIDQHRPTHGKHRDAAGFERQHLAWIGHRRDERSGRKRFALGARDPENPRLDMFFTYLGIRQQLRERAEEGFMSCAERMRCGRCHSQAASGSTGPCGGVRFAPQEESAPNRSPMQDDHRQPPQWANASLTIASRRATSSSVILVKQEWRSVCDSAARCWRGIEKRQQPARQPVDPPRKWTGAEPDMSTLRRKLKRDMARHLGSPR